MAPGPLSILKKGLASLSKSIQTRQESLRTRLARKEAISSSDELWLDNEGNTVDELLVLDTLESASDYNKAVQQLDEKGKTIVQKLREWAGDVPKTVGNKRKRT
jgi:hypothetical protein